MPDTDNTTGSGSRRVRKVLAWLVRLRGSPHAVALGVGIGLVVAFTPTIGFQTLIALAVATFLNANRPVALVPIWITNPVTMGPIYAFTYYLGSFFWSGPAPDVVARAIGAGVVELGSLDFLALRAKLDVLLGLGVDVFIAMWIGGLIVGGIAAAVAYPLTLRTVIRLRARRARRRRRRRERRATAGF